MRACRLWLLVALATLCACDQRLRYADTIAVPLEVPGEAARADLEAQLSPALLEALGGSAPDPWPDWAPRMVLDLALEREVPVVQAQLGKVGEDLARVGAGEVEARLRGARYTYDPGTLTHPVVTGELFVLPDAGTPLDDPEARRVGTLDGLEEAREGTLVFQPGGRRALLDGLASASSVLRLRLWMDFDTGRDRALPGGQGSLDLELVVDVFR
jgi:hypothetical protein